MCTTKRPLIPGSRIQIEVEVIEDRGDLVLVLIGGRNSPWMGAIDTDLVRFIDEPGGP